ncbi:MAG: membrane protein [Flavobacteriaceae bacterium]|jgi:membrane protein
MDLKKEIENFTKNHPSARKSLMFLRKFTLPGFDRIPVFIVIKFIASELQKDLIPTRARSIAYSFFIAFFPGMIFLLTLLPYIPLDGVQAQFFSIINEFVPDKVVNSFILTTVDDVINQPREGLLSFGALLTLYFATQGVVSMIMSFNKTYSIYTVRNFFTLRWVALKLTILLLFLFLISIILLIAGEGLINLFLNYVAVKSFWVNISLNALRYLIILILFFMSISTIYYYGPSVKKKWKFITPGSTLATLGSIIASLIFSNYISGFDKYNTIYGIFGSIILFLSWLYANAFVLLIGFELNAAIYYQSYILQENEDELIA